MFDSIQNIDNVAIPIVGICIIFALMVAAYLEPKKDYSRKIFIFMLVSCTVILVMEMLQSCLPKYRAATSDNLTLWITMFVFYAMLAILCYCWTLYSYYWFNGRTPSPKPFFWFTVAPVVEILALAINHFSGTIFYIDSNGIYERGDWFTSYIMFSYLYLMVAILITAIYAASKKENRHRRDFGMFLLCFLFPVLGPIAQYLLPDLNVMGITEAVALMIVYVSIQQRTTSQYAAEMALFHAEYGQYEDSLEQLLSDSSNALCVFRVNLTANTHSGERGITNRIKNACKSDSMDSLTEAFAEQIDEPDENRRFIDLFNRENLNEQYANHNDRLSLEYHYRLESGEIHLIKVFLSLLKNPGNGDLEAIVYFEDIDRQEKEQKVISAIASREYDNITLIDPATGKINYQYSTNWSVDRQNEDTDDYLSLIEKKIVNMIDLEAPGSEYKKVSLETVLAMLEEQKEYSYVFEYTVDAEKRRKKMTYQYLDQTRSRILFLMSDITEETRQEREHTETLQQALKEVRHADAMKTDFLSNLSHDMRTPLNAVLGYTSLAKTSFDTSDNREYLDKIEQAGKIMLDLVNDTLDLSKIESGAIMLKPVPTYYDEVIKKVSSAIKPLADEKHIDFTLDDEHAARVPFMVDPLRLQEVLMNLLSNAIKFTPENGTVIMTVECTKIEEDYICDVVKVKDNGCGMDAEFIPKMFEPFSQERQKSDTPGSGLGLSIVQKLITMMHGQIEVNSQIGKGTEFIISLRFERADDITDRSNQPARDWSSLVGRKVLLAEDNEMNIEVAKALLEMKGMVVTVAENGQIACQMFEDSEVGAFDVILMDIRMPVMNGHEATKAIRRMKREDAATIPIIAMSADAFDDDIRESMDVGMDGHLAKPIDPERMYESISTALKERTD